MHFDTTGNQLAMEVRDADVLLAHFYTFNLEDHTLKKIPLLPELSWWQGLEDAHAGMLLLHGYGNRKLGQHKGIQAYASASNSITWEQPDLSFYGIAAAGILAFETASPENGFLVLNTDNGNVVSAELNQLQAAELVQQYAPERYGFCTYPVRYQAGETYFDEVQQFISYKLEEEPVQALEYAEINDYIVVSYYLQQPETKLTNYLAVFDAAGNLLLKECLGAGLSGLGSDTFIIFNQNLFFVQNKDVLKVYTLF